MAGEAKTNAFMLSSATVMLGPQAKLWELNPTKHSIGLVKNFQLTAEPQYTELTQGTKNQIVYSVLTSNPVRASMEVYEFTSKNIAYGLGLDGSSLVAAAEQYSLTAAIDNASAVEDSLTLNVSTDVSSKFPAGTFIRVQEGGTDKVHIAKTTGVPTYNGSGTPKTLALTLAPGFEIPAQSADGVPWSQATSKVSTVNVLNVGSKAEQPYLAAKIVGILPDGNKQVTILIPKLRIVKGFSLAFRTDNYGNLPFEFTPYELVATDPFFAEFDGPAKILTET